MANENYKRLIRHLRVASEARSYQCELIQVLKGHLYRTYDWVAIKDLEKAVAEGVPVENLPGVWTAVRVYRKILKEEGG